MKNKGIFLAGIPAVLIAVAGIAQPGPQPRIHVRPAMHLHLHGPESDYTVTEQETIRKSYPLAAEGRKLDVDNIWGSIHVRGTDSDQVQLVANKTIRAETSDALAMAKKEVTLDISQEGNALTFYVNGPFRCQCEDGCNGHRERHYIVEYDFELQVPRSTELELRTVNDGDVQVQDVTGAYSVHNVNGPIDMTNVAGAGQVKTVNGEVKVLFRGNPETNSSFSSLNGNVDLYFLPQLSADLRFKTFNGNVFSDFPMTSLPPRQPVEEHEGSKFVFHADRYTGGRIAAGGPEIKVETFNGDIHILERHD